MMTMPAPYYPFLDELTYCLEHKFPAEVTAAFLALCEDNDLLPEAFEAWEEFHLDDSSDGFLAAVLDIISEKAFVCDDCGTVVWLDETSEIEDEDKRVCDDSCRSEYFTCDGCSSMFSDVTSVGGGYDAVCDTCLERNYTMCYSCDHWEHDESICSINDRNYCESCRDNYFTYCDDCEEYYSDEDGHEHDGCGCVAPHERFEFPANGAGTIAQDKRLMVELPQGTIDDEGLKRIRKALYYSLNSWDHIEQVLDVIGPLWQAKRGNFTKRLSNAFFKDHNIRLDPAVISEVGNIARAHSSATASVYRVEFTRDLNQPAEAFYHDESCWFTSGSYGDSRCCLKNWGGLAMRTYSNMTDDNDCPSGRIFIQPLDGDLKPTHSTLGAHAYMVFNGYGDLDGTFTAARIVAHLTGKTYRKMGYSARHQYINGDVGVLVSDEATCENTSSISIGYDPHDQRDACEQHVHHDTLKVAA